jgi:hypothetical protein
MKEIEPYDIIYEHVFQTKIKRRYMILSTNYR